MITSIRHQNKSTVRFGIIRISGPEVADLLTPDGLRAAIHMLRCICGVEMTLRVVGGSRHAGL
jgi:hypothetical protein